MGFKELFYPESIAIFGSVTPGKLGVTFIEQLLRNGYKNIYAVNPKGASYKTVKGYTGLEQVPQKIDLAMIVSPAATVVSNLEACGKAGIKDVIIISSGFSEAGNLNGEKAVAETAAKYGIRFIGPNCAGLLNTHWNCAATFEAYPPKGSCAIVSQSGAIGGAITYLAQKENLGISKFVSYGNGADLNQVDFLRYLKDDGETTVVAVYIENIKNGREFMAALKELTAVKPVIALKSGRSTAGQRAALSHTGAMAGSDKVYDAAFEECGVIRVDSIDELVDVCKAFQTLPLIKGNKIGIVTNSGGPGVLTTDLAEKLGMDVSEPSPVLKEELRAFLPDFASVRNPVDLTVQGTAENYQKAIEIMLKEYDACIPIFYGTPFIDTLPIAEGYVNAFQNSGKPVAGALESGLYAEESDQLLADKGLPNFNSVERAIKTLYYMYRYRLYKDGAASNEPVNIPSASAAPVELPVLEPQAVGILEENGIPVPPHAFISSRQELDSACRKVDYPLVIKVVSPEIIHKSDFGGVKVNLRSLTEAEEAFDSIRRNAEGYDFRGVMVYPMISGGQEVILGLTRDVTFGPVVAFGLGGIFTELLQDVTLHTAPVSVGEAREMIRKIKGYPMLKGLRGQKPVDFDSLAELIASFSLLPFKYPNLKEADLNPVFAMEKGALAGDIRLVFEE